MMSVPFTKADVCWCQPFVDAVNPNCPMHGINLDPDAMKAIGVAAKEMYEFAAFREKIEELKSSLRDLYDISGEANIPLTSVKNVRKMGEFLRVRERAGKILAREEQL